MYVVSDQCQNLMYMMQQGFITSGHAPGWVPRMTGMGHASVQMTTQHAAGSYAHARPPSSDFSASNNC